MILFKISRGLEENLPTDIVSGNCWFYIDTSNFYIDYTDTDGNLVRSKISGKYAEKLRYSVDGNTIEIDPSEITNLKTVVNSMISVPACSTDDNGKILKVINGVPTWTTLSTQSYYTGSDEPNSSIGEDGDLYLVV